MSDQNHFSFFNYPKNHQQHHASGSLWLPQAVAWHRLAAVTKPFSRRVQKNLTLHIRLGHWFRKSEAFFYFWTSFKADLVGWVHGPVIQECWCFECVLFIVSCVFLMNKQLIGTKCVSDAKFPFLIISNNGNHLEKYIYSQNWYHRIHICTTQITHSLFWQSGDFTVNVFGSLCKAGS